MAPLYHSAMKNVANVRNNLKVKTIFNILGPLINPANADMQLIGVYDKELLQPIAECLKKLGIKKPGLYVEKMVLMKLHYQEKLL